MKCLYKIFATPIFEQTLCQQVVSEIPGEHSNCKEGLDTPSSSRRFSIPNVRAWIKSPENGLSRFLIRLKSPETVEQPCIAHELQPMLGRSRERKKHHRRSGSNDSQLSHMADVTLLIGQKMKHEEISV